MPETPMKVTLTDRVSDFDEYTTHFTVPIH